MNILIAIGLAGFVGFCSYVLGLRRGTKIGLEEASEGYKKDYWDGYADGRLDPHPKAIEDSYQEGFQDGKYVVERRYKADVLLAGLEEAFKDDNVIDSGEY